MAERTRCPHCAEEILLAAKKCKHCGEWVGNKSSSDASSSSRAVSKGIKDQGYSWMCFSFKFWVGLVGLIALDVFVTDGVRRLMHFGYMSSGHMTVFKVVTVAAVILGLAGLARISGQYYRE